MGGSSIADSLGKKDKTWPSGREYGAYGASPVDGSLYVLGGLGIDDSGDGIILDDFWMMNASSREWTFLGHLNATLLFKAKKWANSWAGLDGTFWVAMGEYKRDSPGGSHEPNDLWSYSPQTSEWRKWYEYDSPLGIYETNATVSMRPGARHNAYTTVDAVGDLWIFGGAGNGIAPHIQGERCVLGCTC
jgi:N-acetylneuraminic acid mutarotase